MDLENLKNFDIKDLVSKLKGSEIFSDKKTLVKFSIGFSAILISLIVYHFWISPIIDEKKEKVVLMNDNKLQIEELTMRIDDLTQQITDLKPDYEKNSKLFHNKKEVEDLYQSINNFALANGLSIVNLKKGDPKAVGGPNEEEGMAEMNPDVQQYDEDGNPIDTPAAQQGPLYYQIPVDYEIMGTFLGYLKFRRALSKSLKVINFDKEEINLLKEPQGQVLAKGTISIVGLPNEYN